MESDTNFQEFRKTRRRLLAEWERLNIQIEEVLDRLEENGVTIADAALVEGLRTERRLLLEEYESAADRFVDYLLQSLKTGQDKDA